MSKILLALVCDDIDDDGTPVVRAMVRSKTSDYEATFSPQVLVWRGSRPVAEVGGQTWFAAAVAIKEIEDWLGTGEEFRLKVAGQGNTRYLAAADRVVDLATVVSRLRTEMAASPTTKITQTVAAAVAGHAFEVETAWRIRVAATAAAVEEAFENL